VNNAQSTGGMPTGIQFVAYDGNGNVAGLFAASDGSNTARYEYGPFGEPLRNTGPLAAANPVRWSTKVTDDESGLVYYGYRYYISATGRWLNRDPMSENWGLNLYCMLDGDSVNGVDVLGLFKPGVHHRITVNALKNRGLGEKCIATVAVACVAQDAGAVKGLTGGYRNLPFFDPLNHGDDNRIPETITRIGERMTAIKSSLCQDCKEIYEALEAFGRILHGLQDLYAHSTYVETFGKKARTAGEVPLWIMFNPDGSPNVPKGVISGNYDYPGDDASPPRHKDLNKDEPSSPRGGQLNDNGITYFSLAEDAAIRASAETWRNYWNGLTPAQRRRFVDCCKDQRSQ